MVKIGIDLGGTSVKYGIVDENNTIIEHYSIPTLANRSFEVIVKDIADATLDVLKKANLTLDDVEYIGMGVPSSVNPINNQIVFTNNLNWRDVDIITEFNKTIDKKV